MSQPEGAFRAQLRARRAAIGDDRRWQLIALAVVVAIGSFVVLYAGRGSYWFFDDWDYLVDRTFLDEPRLLGPQNKNLFAGPVPVFLVLSELFGVGTYLPVRLADYAVFLSIAVMVYLYARPRIGPWWALLPVGVFMATPGAEIVLWPLQIAQLFSLALGLGALMLVDWRANRWTLPLAAVALFGAVLSSSAGIPMLAFFIADRVLRRETALQALVAAPTLLFYAWWLHAWGKYSPATNPGGIEGWTSAVHGSFDAAYGAMSGTLGFHRYGWSALAGMLALGGFLVLLAWRLFGPHTADRRRILALLAGLGSFWVLLAYGRGYMPGFNVADRYQMISQLFLLLIFVELGASLRQQASEQGGVFGLRWGHALAISIGGLVVLGSIWTAAQATRTLRDSGIRMRLEGDAQRGQIAALALLTPEQRAGKTFFVLPRTEGFPRGADRFVFGLFDRFDTPLPTEDDLKGYSPDARAGADITFLRNYAPQVAAEAPVPAPAGAAPAITSTPDVVVKPAGRSCVDLTGTSDAAAAALPSGFVGTVTATGTGNSVLRAQRYGTDWGKAGALQIPPDTSRAFRIEQDTGSTPWQVRVEGRASRVCSTQ